MKKQLVILQILCIYSLMSSAQISKNGIFLLGNYSFSDANQTQTNTPPQTYTGINTSKSKRYGYSFGVGYSITEKWLVGAFFRSIYTRDSRATSGVPFAIYDTEQTENQAGVMARNYLQLRPKFYYFTEINGGYIFGNQTQEGPVPIDTYPNSAIVTKKSTLNGYTVSLRPGFSYFIYKRLSFEISSEFLSFRTTKTTGDGIDNNDTSLRLFPNSLLGSLNLGISFYFSKKTSEDVQ